MSHAPTNTPEDIGGTSLADGHGTVPGTILGVLLLGVVANALNLLQVRSCQPFVLTGGVLLVAAVVSEFQRKSVPAVENAAAADRCQEC